MLVCIYFHSHLAYDRLEGLLQDSSKEVRALVGPPAQALSNKQKNNNSSNRPAPCLENFASISSTSPSTTTNGKNLELVPRPSAETRSFGKAEGTEDYSNQIELIEMLNRKGN